jgi:hypothetical protein
MTFLSEVRAVTVCIGYDELLAITLPRMLEHLRSVLVITEPEDTATQQLVQQYSRAFCLKTNACTDYGMFNKGRGIDEGLDIAGRTGWLLIINPDIVLPPVLTEFEITPDKLYMPRRRVLEDAESYTDDLDWQTVPLRYERQGADYFQLFHASNPVLSKKPWYSMRGKTSHNCSLAFQKRWQAVNKVRLPFEVLHLGSVGISPGTGPDANYSTSD